MHLNSLAIALFIVNVTTVMACDSSKPEQDKLKISFLLNPGAPNEVTRYRATRISPSLTTAFEKIHSKQGSSDVLTCSEEQTEISHKEISRVTPPNPKNARLENTQLFDSGIICPRLLENQPPLEAKLQPAMMSPIYSMNLQERIQAFDEYRPQSNIEQTTSTQKLVNSKSSKGITFQQFTQKYNITLKELRQQFSSVTCVRSITEDTVRAVLYLISLRITQKQISQEMGICHDYLSEIRAAQSPGVLKIKKMKVLKKDAVQQKIEQFIKSRNINMNALHDEFPTIPPHKTRLSDDGMRVIALLKKEGFSVRKMAQDLDIGRGIIDHALEEFTGVQ